MFDDCKTRMIRLPYGEKNYDDMLSRFHLIPERFGRTDRLTDRQTYRFAMSMSPSERCHPVLCGKTRMVGLPDGEKSLRICITV